MALDFDKELQKEFETASTLMNAGEYQKARSAFDVLHGGELEGLPENQMELRAAALMYAAETCFLLGDEKGGHTRLSLLDTAEYDFSFSKFSMDIHRIRAISHRTKDQFSQMADEIEKASEVAAMKIKESSLVEILWASLMADLEGAKQWGLLMEVAGKAARIAYDLQHFPLRLKTQAFGAKAARGLGDLQKAKQLAERIIEVLDQFKVDGDKREWEAFLRELSAVEDVPIPMEEVPPAVEVSPSAEEESKDEDSESVNEPGYRLHQDLLRLLLFEIFKDGRVVDEEKQKLMKVYKLLKLDRDTAQEIVKEVKQSVEVDRGGGSADFQLFLNQARELLASHYSREVSEDMIEAIADVMALKID